MTKSFPLNITAETSGSMVLVKRNNELISVKEINPNDVNKGFKRVCDSIDTYVKSIRNKNTH
jgi:hypothetical protein